MKEKKDNKPKLWKYILLTILGWMLGNFVFELCIELIENSTEATLYNIFPGTRIITLITSILVAKYYWNKQKKGVQDGRNR